MNTLSWVLILADVLPSLAMAICVASFVLFMSYGIMVFLGYADFIGAATYEKDGVTPSNDLALIAIRFRKLWYTLPLFAALWFMSFAVPNDKETYYGIAASEIGEQIIHTQTASRAVRALDAWLDRQLAETRPTAGGSNQPSVNDEERNHNSN